MRWCRIFLAVGLLAALGCAGVRSLNGGAGQAEPKTSEGGSDSAPPEATPPSSASGPGLSLSVLRRTSFPCEQASGGLAQLTDGQHVEPLSDGTGEQLKVTLMENKIAWGELSGDGQKDAAVVLVAEAGRTGTFYELVAVVSENGEADPRASVELGDRIRVNGVSIMDGKIYVDVTRRGPHDPIGNPTQRVKESYFLRDRSLELVDRVEVLR